MQKYEESMRLSRKQIIINNFIGGLAWALGSTVGLTLFAAILAFVLGKVNLIPVIGSYLNELNRFMTTHP